MTTTDLDRANAAINLKLKKAELARIAAKLQKNFWNLATLTPEERATLNAE